MSNIKDFKYCWTWDKTTAKGHLVAKIRPMQQTEDILVFGKNKINYYPQMIDRPKNKIETTSEGKRTEIMGGVSKNYTKTYTQWYPKTLLKFTVKRGFHPTQKPVALGRYLIRTYTNEGDLILDNTCGSGSFLVSAMLEKRNFVGIELDENYCAIARKRLEDTQKDIDNKLSIFNFKKSEVI